MAAPDDDQVSGPGNIWYPSNHLMPVDSRTWMVMDRQRLSCPLSSGLKKTQNGMGMGTVRRTHPDHEVWAWLLFTTKYFPTPSKTILWPVNIQECSHTRFAKGDIRCAGMYFKFLPAHRPSYYLCPGRFFLSIRSLSSFHLHRFKSRPSSPTRSQCRRLLNWHHSSWYHHIMDWIEEQLKHGSISRSSGRCWPSALVFRKEYVKSRMHSRTVSILCNRTHDLPFSAAFYHTSHSRRVCKIHSLG